VFGGEEGMFLRRYQRTKDGKRHSYFALVESVRTERGPRQRVVAQLGELSEDQQHRWEQTAVFHTVNRDARQLRLFDDPSIPDEAETVRVRLGKVGWSNARSFGDVWLGLHVWRLLKLDRIIERHLPAGRETVPPASVVAIEVINRLCIGQGGATSELALAEEGYRRTALEDLLGVPDEQVTKDRLYRTLDELLSAKDGIEQDLKEQLGELFHLSYDLVLCDLTSSFFEGLAEENDLAKRGYSRDQRSDCKQVVLALVVTGDGFPLWHETWSGNKADSTALPTIVEAVQKQFGTARRIWVVDRGLASAKSVAYLKEHSQSFLVGTPKGMLKDFEAELCTRDWAMVKEQVQVKVVQRDGQAYVLARSKARRSKERAMRRRQLHGLREDVRGLAKRVAGGRLKDAGKVQQAIGRLAERWPAAWRLVEIQAELDAEGQAASVRWTWQKQKLRRDAARDGAYLLLSDQTSWTAQELWRAYIQLTRAEDAFRTMKSQELLRPIWHHLGNRVKAHVFVCVLAYALWKGLEHLLRGAGAMTRIAKPDERRGRASPQDRPMSVAAALRLMHDVPMGDILLQTVEGRTLRLRRVARPNEWQAELLAALELELPERLCADVEVVSEARAPGLPAGMAAASPPSGGSEM
jgi:transposase